MKRLILLCFTFIALNAAFSQAPEQFKYQAVLRDGSGIIKANTSSTILVDILQDNPDGTAIFSETHIASTNAQGVVNLNIGSITSGLGAIDWAADTYYIRITVDGTEMGTSQLLSVPYAIYAAKAGNGFSGNWLDLTDKPDLFSGSYVDLSGKPEFAAVATSGSYSDLLGKPVLFSGSYTDLTGKPALFSGSYADLTSKPTFATIATSGSYNDLLNKPAPYFAGSGIQFNGSIISTNLSLQVSETGDILTLTPGNSVYVPGISNANSTIPIVTTKPVTNITSTKAYGNGKLVYYGITPITETGICWSLNQPPVVSDNYAASGAYNDDFICIMNSLTANTVYFARAYAKTGTGTYYYGQTVMFTTTDILPVATLTTTEVNSITETAALSGGNISANGGSAVTARGVCWSKTTGPTIDLATKTSNGTGNGIFTSSLTGLTLNTQYYVRAFATNANGTSYGPELIFKTAGTIPTVTTSTQIGVTESSAILGGNVTAQGTTAVTERGVCIGLSMNPSITDWKVAIGSGTGTFTQQKEDLWPFTTWYVRAYATNSVGTAYGANITFTTADAFVDGFETGCINASCGWSNPSGSWSISTSDRAQGYFSLYTNTVGSEISFTRTLLSSGYITFWSKNTNISDIWGGGFTTTSFYIDGIEQIPTSPSHNTVWQKISYPVAAGAHSFKWKNNVTGGYTNQTWIDFIIMPK